MRKSVVLRLRTYSAMFGSLIRLRWLYLLSWIGLALSLPIGGTAGQIVGWAGLTMGLILFLVDTLRVVQETTSLQVDAVHHAELDGFTIFPFNSSQPGSLLLKVDASPWAIQGLHPAVEERYKIIRARAKSGSDLTNGTKVRICNDPDKHQVIHVRPTKYFSGLVTNEFAGFRLMRKGFVTYDPVGHIWKNGQLLNLTDSPASNHLGVGALVQTVDHRYVIQQGSRRANVGSRKASPSVSGSVDWTDISAITLTLDDLARSAIVREFKEETGLTPVDWLDLDTLKPTGFGRIHARGGKPEISYTVRSPLRASEWVAALEVPPEPETQRFHVIPVMEAADVVDYVSQELGLTTSHSLLFLLHTLTQSNGPSCA